MSQKALKIVSGSGLRNMPAKYKKKTKASKITSKNLKRHVMCVVSSGHQFDNHMPQLDTPRRYPGSEFPKECPRTWHPRAADLRLTTHIHLKIVTTLIFKNIELKDFIKYSIIK